MKLISRTAAAKLLDCTPQTITNYAKQGLIDEVVRENAGRSTMFYDEVQLRELLPDLHELEELKAMLQAEKEQLRLELADLARARDEARRENLKIHGGKKTMAHLQELLLATFHFARRANPTAVSSYEEKILSLLLDGKASDDILDEIGCTPYRLKKSIGTITRSFAQLPNLLKENNSITAENMQLRSENRILRSTIKCQYKNETITIRTVDPSQLPVDELKNISVDNLRLEPYIIKSIKTNGIQNLHQLLSYTERELEDLPCLNLDKADIIQHYVEALGMRLGMTKV